MPRHRRTRAGPNLICPRDAAAAGIVDIGNISKYIFSWYAKENRLKEQAALAAANTDRRDLLPLVQALIGSEDKMLDKMARWAAEQLSVKMIPGYGGIDKYY